MRPALVINPGSDTAFMNAADRQVANGIESAIEMERVLQETFPRAVVRERSISGERYPTWYVYRDGSWVPNEPPAA